VKRILLEELGTYLESHTEIVNFQLRKDQITAFTAGVVQTQILKEKWDGAGRLSKDVEINGNKLVTFLSSNPHAAPAN
jgi:hypothetical protein